MHLPRIEVGSTYRPQYSFPQVTDISNARDYARVVEMPYDTGSGLENGQIYVANDSRFTAGAYNQALTTFAVGGWNNTGLERELMLYTGAPVMVSKRFSYKVWTNAEALKSDLTDDIRAVGGDFKEVRLGNTEVSTQVANRGLIMVLDKDDAVGSSNLFNSTNKLIDANLKFYLSDPATAAHRYPPLTTHHSRLSR